MVRPPFAVLASLGVALTAIELFPFLRRQQSVVVPSTPMTTTTHPDTITLDGAVEVELVPFQVLPLFAATAALFAAVSFVHLHHAAAAAGRKRLSELVPFTLCGAAGVLLFFLFVLPADAVDDDVGSLSHALGRAAVDLLPASAAVVFFLGITLVIAHIRAGGEGGGGEVAGNRRVSVPVLLLKKIALGAAAALLGQISIALYLK